MSTPKVELAEGHYEVFGIPKIDALRESIFSTFSELMKIDIYPTDKYLVKFYSRLREISEALGVKPHLIMQLETPLKKALRMIFSFFPRSKVDLNIDIVEDIEIQNWRMLRIAFVVESSDYEKLQEIWTTVSRIFAEETPKELLNKYYVVLEPRELS